MHALLAAASDAPVRWPRDRQRAGLAALHRYLDAADDPELRAYLIYASSLTEEGDVSAARWLWPVRQRLSTPSLAYLTMAADRMGTLSTADKEALLAELAQRAEQTATFAWWPMADGAGRLPEGSLYATGLVVQLFLQWAPSDELAVKATDWLLRSCPEAGEELDSVAAQRILALVEASRVQVQPTEGVLRVALEGIPLLEQKIDTMSALSMHKIELPGLRPGSNWVEIRLEGSGPLYFASFLRSVFDGRWLPSAHSSDGFLVRRQYLSPRLRRPSVEFSTGQLILVGLDIEAPTTLYNVTVSDQVPAGCKPIAGSLVATGVTHSDLAIGQDGGRVRFRLPELPKGRHIFYYLLRTETPGQVRVMPALVYLTYRTSLWGRSAETLLTFQSPSP
jgi:uncharacterized protein YfaS (alpha-2-macroglobulin family)